MAEHRNKLQNLLGGKKPHQEGDYYIEDTVHAEAQEMEKYLGIKFSDLRIMLGIYQKWGYQEDGKIVTAKEPVFKPTGHPMVQRFPAWRALSQAYINQQEGW